MQIEAWKKIELGRLKKYRKNRKRIHKRVQIMKDIREQILEMADKYKAPCRFGITSSDMSILALEIEFYIKENFVEKEFVGWIQNDCPFWYEMINKYWEEPDSEKKYTLNELYDYWKQHISEK